MYETIQYSTENGVALITLNRPNTLNAFVAQMNREIIQALKAASSKEEVRCIVITCGRCLLRTGPIRSG